MWEGIVGGLITAGIAGFIAIINAIHKNTSESRVTGFTQLMAINEQLRTHVNNQDTHINAMQISINELRDRLSESEADERECRVRLEALHRIAISHARVMREKGWLVEEIEDLPPPRERRRSPTQTTDFIANTARANTELLKKEKEDIDNQNPARLK